MEELIAEAIENRNLLQFHYSAGTAPGVRVVEPHMLADNRKGRAVLSAWLVEGASASGEGEGWREYLLESVSAVVVLEDEFDGPRPGYNASGGKNFTNVRAAL